MSRAIGAARRPEGPVAAATGARRPECRGEGVDAREGAVGPATADVGAVQVLNVVEQSLAARVNALEKLTEELIEVLDSEGYLYVAIWRERLRDLTEESE